jgi:hypothetical protein
VHGCYVSQLPSHRLLTHAIRCDAAACAVQVVRAQLTWLWPCLLALFVSRRRAVWPSQPCNASRFWRIFRLAFCINSHAYSVWWRCGQQLAKPQYKQGQERQEALRRGGDAAVDIVADIMSGAWRCSLNCSAWGRCQMTMFSDCVQACAHMT